MRRLAAVPAVAAVLLLAGCGGAQSSVAAGPANVTGVVVAGPRCPVVTAEDPCPDTPVGGVGIMFTPSSGGDPTSVTAAADGTFSVSLAPGDYVALVQADLSKGVMSAKPEGVTVPATGAVRVTLHGDTGIR